MRRFIYQVLLYPEDGGYRIEVPDLPGCISFGETRREAVCMAADALRTYLASLLKHGECIPEATFGPCPSGAEAVVIYVETDEDYLVDEPVMSAAAAARSLSVSPGRVTQLIDAGILDGFRRGRRTFVSEASVARRLAEGAHAGRPPKRAVHKG